MNNTATSCQLQKINIALWRVFLCAFSFLLAFVMEEAAVVYDKVSCQQQQQQQQLQQQQQQKCSDKKMINDNNGNFDFSVAIFFGW